jgi:TnpA family transposase
MPHRTLLSPEQRTRVLGIPTAAAEMAKHYVLSTEDLALVRTKRRLSNRLGFAVQLCALRHPGRPLERSEVPPAAMLAFVANQVGADPKLFGDYAHRAETRREHLLELQQYLRLRSFRLADWRACLNVGANAAWATDRGEPIVQAILAHLRAERVLVPAAAVLERIGLAARVRARKRVFQVLAEGLSNCSA